MSLDPKSCYYDAGGIESIDIIRAKLTPEQWEGYLLGSCLKYATRMNFKGQKERDAEKLALYSSLLKKSLFERGLDETSVFSDRPEGGEMQSGNGGMFRKASGQHITGLPFD